MKIRSYYPAAALAMALTLSGCEKLPSSGTEGKPSAQASQGGSGTSEQATVLDAADIARELSSGNYDNAVKGAQAAISADPQNPELFLLLARAQARLQNVGAAVKALQAAFDAGFHDPRGALNNPDFDGVRTNPIFAEFANKFQRKQPSSASKSRSSPVSSITAGDVSIIEGSDGHSRIRAGDIDLRD